MRKKMLCVIAALCATTAHAADKPIIAPPADWVKPLPVPVDTTPADGAAIRILSTDLQLRFGEHGDSIYSENVVRIQTPQGLATMGTFAVGWKPETDILTVHKLQIRRGNQIIDVLANGQQFTVLRRENGLEYAALDGVLTATIQPEGLLVGDIVDFAYTLDRSDPLLKGHSDQILARWAQLPIGQVHIAAQWPKSKPIHIRPIDMPAVPFIGKGTFTLNATKVDPLVIPKGAPLRFLIGRQVEFSDYASWAELSAIFAPLFGNARTLHVDSPLKAEIARIRATSSDPARQVEAALALVQDQIRYLYLGLNEGNLRPAEADATWLRRYGDCKAKTALLLALLDGLGIPAEAALISVRTGDGLDERLPMLSVFDHVIVRATIAGKVYWLDGTRTGDRSLARLKVPGFRWALPVRSSGARLERLIVPQLEEPQQTTDIHLDASAGITQPAKVHAEILFTGDEAIGVRNTLANLQSADLDRALRGYWTREYDFMTPTSVSARFDEANGTEHLLMEGAAKLDWNASQTGAYYEIDGSRLGWRPDFTREPGPHKDAPFGVVFPDYTLTRETISLPGEGHGFTLDGNDVDTTLAGYQFHRKTAIKGKIVTMEASRRSIGTEISVADAETAVESLRTLSKRSVYVNVPTEYKLTDAEGAALLALEPKNPEDFIRRAHALVTQGKTTDAIEALDHAVAADPKMIEALNMRADLQHTLGHFTLASADLARVLAIDPKNPYALLLSAQVNGGKDPKAAIAALNATILKRPDNSSLRYARALLYRQNNEQDLALADAREAIRLDPGLIDAYLLSANILKARGKKEDTAAIAEAMTQANPENADAFVYAGAIWSSSDHPVEGRRAFDRAIAIKPTVSAFLTRHTYRPAEDETGRRADIDAALKIDPNSVDALKALASLQRRQKDVKGAVATLLRAIALDPDNQPISLALASAYARNGQSDLARKTFASVRLKAEKNASLLNGLCWDATAIGFDLDLALQDCKAAAALNDHRADILDSLGFVLLRLKRYDEAIAAYDAALKLYPTLADSLFGRGLALQAKGPATAGNGDLKAARTIDGKIDKKFAEYGVMAMTTTAHP